MFVNLGKAYDHVSQENLWGMWQVLTAVCYRLSTVFLNTE